MIKLATISLLSLTVSILLCYSALFTAKQIARISLVKTETVLDNN